GVVPAEDLLGPRLLEPERVGHGRGGERAGQLAPQLGLAGRGDRVEQPADLVGHRRAEALAHGVEPERARERRAVAAVGLAVEREHARAYDLAGREALVVDRERVR